MKYRQKLIEPIDGYAKHETRHQHRLLVRDVRSECAHDIVANQAADDFRKARRSEAIERHGFERSHHRRRTDAKRHQPIGEICDGMVAHHRRPQRVVLGIREIRVAVDIAIPDERTPEHHRRVDERIVEEPVPSDADLIGGSIDWPQRAALFVDRMRL